MHFTAAIVVGFIDTQVRANLATISLLGDCTTARFIARMSSLHDQITNPLG